MKGAGCKYMTFVRGNKTYSKWFPRFKQGDEWVYFSDETTPTKMVECESRKEALAYSRNALTEMEKDK